jgi:glutamate 5-kinase
MDKTKRTASKAPSVKRGGQYSRLVIKLGTNLLTGGGGHLDIPTMTGLVDQVAQLHRQGLEIVLVSSGSIAAGRDKLGVDSDRKDIPFRQVMAAVGQGRVMHAYEGLFDRHSIVVAQALLTKRELSHRAGYLNARNTILSLLSLGVVPIINENDVLSTDEIKEEKFGDNDNLSALVANLVDADLLVLLSDVQGLYTADPRKDRDAKLIATVKKIDAEIENMGGGAGTSRGTGGMATKIEAAKLATRSGITVVITEGSIPNVIIRLAEGESVGTLFLPASTKLESRQRWMVSRLASRGKIVIDDGAATAVRRQKGSLLPAGIKDTEREFRRGDMVDIVDQQGNRIACGMSNYSAAEIQTIKGAQSKEIMSLLGYEYGAEVVHRNNLVVL